MSEQEAARDRVGRLVDYYSARLSLFRQFVENLRVMFEECEDLKPLVHSMRARVKDPDHLRNKLLRKVAVAEANGVDFDITEDNLFERINDLAGFRILHLHTKQFAQINSQVLGLLEENRYPLIEGPIARVWDEEYSEYFQSIGVQTQHSPRMYTSVHYLIEANTKTKYTGEIQIRTLAEELWGEVDHRINYPLPSSQVACREQIKVLARITSSCTRLVDSIFTSHAED